MSIERRSLTTELLDRNALHVTNAGDGVHLEIRDRFSDELVATVSVDDIFDKDGNRFHNDLD